VGEEDFRWMHETVLPSKPESIRSAAVACYVDATLVYQRGNARAR
jgi:hypothetical protein